MSEKEEVFISYSSRDRDAVRAFVSHLRGAGVTVWMDESGIDGAAYWSKEIVSAIENCKAGILMVSGTSVASDNVGREVHLLYKKGKKILPLYLEDVEIPPEMEYELARIQHLMLFKGEPGDIFTAVLHALENLGVRVKKRIRPDDLFDGAPLPEPRPPAKQMPAKMIGIAAAAILAVIIAVVAPRFLTSQNETPLPTPTETVRTKDKTSQGTGPVAKTDDSAPSEEVSPSTTENPIPDKTPRASPESETRTNTVREKSPQPPPTSAQSAETRRFAFSVAPLVADDGTDYGSLLFGAMQAAHPDLALASLDATGFEAAYAGDIAALAQTGTIRDAEALVLGRLNLSFQQKSALDQDIISCNLNFSYRAVDAGGKGFGANSFRVVGAGFSNQDAAKNAMEKLVAGHAAEIFGAER